MLNTFHNFSYTAFVFPLFLTQAGNSSVNNIYNSLFYLYFLAFYSHYMQPLATTITGNKPSLLNSQHNQYFPIKKFKSNTSQIL